MIDSSKEDSMTEESLDIITMQSIEDGIQHMLDVQEESYPALLL